MNRVRRQQAREGDADPVAAAVKVARPEIEERALALGVRARAVLLPDETLQQGRVIPQSVENLGSRRAIAGKPIGEVVFRHGFQAPLALPHALPRHLTIVLLVDRKNRLIIQIQSSGRGGMCLRADPGQRRSVRHGRAVLRCASQRRELHGSFFGGTTTQSPTNLLDIFRSNDLFGRIAQVSHVICAALFQMLCEPRSELKRSKNGKEHTLWLLSMSISFL